MKSAPIRLFFMTCMLATAIVVAKGAYAETGQSAQQSALMGLAKKFVNRIGEGFDRADRYWQSGIEKEQRDKRFMTDIADGEMLLLQIGLGPRLKIDQAILAIKEGDDVMVSLTDFVRTADFAIEVKGLEGQAEGWYIREDRGFQLDIASGTALVNDKLFKFSGNEVRADNADILVKGQTLAEWFDFDLKVNFALQSFEVETAEKWPIQERLERKEKKGISNRARLPPQLPRQQDDYNLASVPYVDVNITQRYRKDADKNGGDTTNETAYRIEAAGDFLAHTGEVQINGNDEDKLNAVRAKLSKTSENNDLLGPLEARSYEVGDVATVRLPLGGSAGSELGARVTNKDPLNTYDTILDITGTAPPGWDVELLRDKQFVSLQTVSDDGFYVFEDVLLFSGENIFNIVQYGPQGEIRRDRRVFNVNTSLADGQKGTYDVSVSASNTQTYRKEKPDDPDENTPHIAATYAQQINPKWEIHGGIQSRSEDDVNKVYVNAGTTGIVKGTILNADLTAENEGAFSASLTNRARIGQHRLFNSTTYRSEDYEPGKDVESPDELIFNSTIRGPVPYLKIGKRPIYDFRNEYSINGDDAEQYTSRLNLTTQFDSLSVGNNLEYERTTDDSGVETEVRGAFSMRGHALGMRWRGSAAYDIHPENRITQYALELQRRFNDQLQGRIKVEHDPIPKFTEVETSLQWVTDDFSLAPRLAYNSDDAINASLNLRFGLAQNPYDGDLYMDPLPVTNNGGVSALVFLDRDGNQSYSDGDELLEDVVIEAVHARRSASTNEAGEAFLYDLPTNRITDIQLKEASFFDPFWIPGFEGISILPRPGHVVRTEFPVHIAGEIDGTVYTKTPDGQKISLRNVRLHLYDMEGKVVQSSLAAFDGFYIFSRVPPGQYLLMIDERDALNRNFARPQPQEIEIGYEGTVILGNDLYVRSNETDIPVSLADMNDLINLHNHIDIPSLEGHNALLDLGEYNSRLLMGVTWFRLKSRYGDLLNDTDILVPPSQSYASAETGKHHLLTRLPDGMTLQDAYERCRSFVVRGFYCRVGILPKTTVKEARANAPEKI